jgi:hypothetical protein
MSVGCHVQGLPVLTLQGEAFPSRVAASLYASFTHDVQCDAPAGIPSYPGCLLEKILVTDSAKDFVDTATRVAHFLADQRRLPHKQRPEGAGTADLGRLHLASTLDDVIEGMQGLFNATRNVELFVRGMQALQETRNAVSAAPSVRPFHVALL